MVSVRARERERVLAFGNGCLTWPWGAAPIRQRLIKRVSYLLTASQTHTHTHTRMLTCSDKTDIIWSFFHFISVHALYYSFVCFVYIWFSMFVSEVHKSQTDVHDALLIYNLIYTFYINTTHLCNCIICNSNFTVIFTDLSYIMSKEF